MFGKEKPVKHFHEWGKWAKVELPNQHYSEKEGKYVTAPHGWIRQERSCTTCGLTQQTNLDGPAALEYLGR